MAGCGNQVGILFFKKSPFKLMRSLEFYVVHGLQFRSGNLFGSSITATNKLYGPRLCKFQQVTSALSFFSRWYCSDLSKQFTKRLSVFKFCIRPLSFARALRRGTLPLFFFPFSSNYLIFRTLPWSS